ncbi:putative helix-turn-helix, AraC-type transcriptional regulator [Bradyrhizobium oligotrophicum S58]|uniref:Putative helix-turn-helix, AraC-type transcriptional regulator n=1 Tax=Bradyrhizobium oligotrophicum S58 TaxID=1245469 RepID=M4ZG77_9BRAD|nr:transcriptional regulator FtrA [Bradyrhizobium oligotrophicum]BAM92857.1 putative helix-turn-helix, AraC-type transcriptional regulator [Bradyrhizobium oligotrophicum S58]
MPPAAANTRPRDPGLVAVIAYDGLCTFEFGIAVEVFGLPRPEFDFSWYQFTVVAAEGRRSRAIGGVVIEAGASLARLKAASTIIVPGWRDRNERPPERLLRAISQAAARGARCVSICSGVFVLAAAGLLDGKRATTHWRHIPDLKRLYPDISVEEDTLYVDEGNVITSAGSAAGIDACLHLVRRDFGSRVANAVARRLVMPPHRDGGQAQYVVAPVQARPGRTIGEVMDWARARLSHPIAISAMAKRARMSERTFLRRFSDGTGSSPAAWLQQERMARARELLENATLSLADVSAQCGYQSLETFRVAFRRSVGTSPAAYRSRFRTGAS